jgi:signal transduction histidine kinase
MAKKLKFNHIILISLLVAIVTAILGVLLIFLIRGSISEQLVRTYKEQERGLVTEVASSIEKNIADVQKNLEIMALAPEVINSSNTTICNQKLREYFKAIDNRIGNLGRVNAEGVFDCSVNPSLIGTPASALGDYVTELIRDPQHKPVMSHKIRPPGTDTYAAAIHVPVYDKSGTFSGTLGGAIYFDQIQEKYLRDVKFGTNGFAILFDDNGDILYHPRSEFIGKNVAQPEIKNLYIPTGILESFIHEAQTNETGEIYYAVEGEEKIASYRTLTVPGRKMVVVATVPIAEVYSLVRSTGIDTAFISVTIILTVSLGLLTFVMLIGQRRAQELEHAKDEFVSLASHQLRTPATAVKQFIGMFLEGYAGKLTKEQTAIMQQAYDSNERQIRIVEDLLNVARLESGKLRISLAKVDLRKLVEASIQENTVVTDARRQHISSQLPARPVHISIDVDLFRMVIDNLISNASKYTPEKGNILVTLKEEVGSVLLSVKDNGVGIAANDIPKLFKKFSRIDNSLSTKVGGTGLGLYILKQIIEMHKGTIEVKSKPGQGTLFTITLNRK